MRVLLLNPPFRRRIGNIWRYVSGVLPPLGLGYIAAVLEREGIEVDILDASAEGVSGGLLPRRIGERPYDIVGITATTTMFPSAMAAARIIKDTCPRTKIIMGGVHATACPEEALADGAVDMVVAGEGEMTFLEIARGDDPAGIPGIFMRDGNGAIKSAGPRPLIHDLDTLPFPAYHKMPMRLYRPAIGGYFRLPAIHMMTSRGCSHRCSYCYHVFGRGVRFRSVECVIDEIKYMISRYGVREVYFYDDTFNARRDRVEKICEALLKLSPKLGWSCLARVDGMDPELINLMRRSGCHSITYGLESVDPVVLKNVHKRLSLEEAERVIRQSIEAGIITRVGLMLGNPGETRESFARSLRFALDNCHTGAMFNIVAPYPGTEMFEWGVKEGFIKNFNWEQYDFSTPILEIPGMTAAEIKRSQKWGNKRLFLRPALIWTIIKHFRTPAGAKEAVMGALSVIGALEAYDRFDYFLRGIKEN